MRRTLLLGRQSFDVGTIVSDTRILLSQEIFKKVKKFPFFHLLLHASVTITYLIGHIRQHNLPGVCFDVLIKHDRSNVFDQTFFINHVLII